jgi:acetyltransferase-like isoleucine patch superfamily enzyme
MGRGSAESDRVNVPSMGEARIAESASIGPYTIVHDNVVVGERVVIESHCVIGHPNAGAGDRPLIIGNDSLIRSHSVFYAGSTFGPGLVSGHRVTVRELIDAGERLQIGTLSDFQGHMTIGDDVRTHSNVHLGQGAKIGSYVWIFPYVVLTNDPHPPSNVMRGVTIEDFAVVATHATILPGVRIGTRALVGAHSLVRADVPPDTVVSGVPAVSRGATNRIRLKDGSGKAYPWMRHFHRGYPEDVVASWIEEYRTE